MPTVSMATETNLRKRRGIFRAQVTRLITCVSELESLADQPRTADHAQELLTKLQTIDSDFKKLHFELIDQIEEEDNETLEREQGVMDKFGDDVSDLTVRLRALLTPTTPTGATAMVLTTDHLHVNYLVYELVWKVLEERLLLMMLSSNVLN